MNWKKFTILSCSILLTALAANYAYSCIMEDIYYAYPSFFGNKTPEKLAYRPFFYVTEDHFYNNYDDKEQDNTDLLNLENLKEWQAYTKQKGAIPLQDIDSLINKYSISDLKNIALGETNNLPNKKKNNSFTKWLAQNKSTDAIDYLVYAKECEPFVSVQNDWDTIIVNIDSSDILINSGLNLWAQESNKFLKPRYAFQILRLAFYNKKYDRTLRLYDSLVGQFSLTTASLSDYRNLGFKAGVYYRRKDYPKAAYLYSKIFGGPDGLKETAMISYSWSTHPHLDKDQKNILPATYALCANDHERAVITIMEALRATDKALPLIEKAYALDPSIEGIDVLVNREINKMEERYQAHFIDQANGIQYDPYYEYFDGQPPERQDYLMDSVRNTYPGYLGQLNAFTQKMITEKKSGRPAFWHLASAYISYLIGDAKQIDTEMHLAKMAGMNNKDSQLYQVLGILKTIKNQTIITTAVENKLLPQLKALDELSDQNSDMNQNFYSIMNLLLAPRYMAQKDTVKALYCMAHSQRKGTVTYGMNNIYYHYDIENISSKYFVDIKLTDRPGNLLDHMNIDGLHKVQTFLANSSKTPYDAWLVENTYYNKNNLKELEGTKYIRAFQFKAAATILKDIPHLDSLNYPFEMHINDITDIIYPQDTKVVTTKYTFAKEMATLQEAIQSNPKNTLALYKYSLGLYGMTYYGRSPHIFSYFRSTSDEYKYYKTKERDQLPAAFQEYYGLYTAEKYFNMAAKSASTATLKAKCTFGAAKCWQKRCNQDRHSDNFELNYVAYSLANPYFKTLKTQYSESEFTKALYNTCSYYRDYVKKN